MSFNHILPGRFDAFVFRFYLRRHLGYFLFIGMFVLVTNMRNPLRVKAALLCMLAGTIIHWLAFHSPTVARPVRYVIRRPIFLGAMGTGIYLMVTRESALRLLALLGTALVWHFYRDMTKTEATSKECRLGLLTDLRFGADGSLNGSFTPLEPEEAARVLSKCGYDPLQSPPGVAELMADDERDQTASDECLLPEQPASPQAAEPVVIVRACYGKVLTYLLTEVKRKDEPMPAGQRFLPHLVKFVSPIRPKDNRRAIKMAVQYLGERAVLVVFLRQSLMNDTVFYITRPKCKKLGRQEQEQAAA